MQLIHRILMLCCTNDFYIDVTVNANNLHQACEATHTLET